MSMKTPNEIHEEVKESFRYFAAFVFSMVAAIPVGWALGSLVRWLTS